ncbi:MAG: carbohydrate ABC transporter permease, partial [Bacteroidota bacterium]
MAGHNFINKKTAPYIFISPFYILFTVFMFYPVIYSFYLSFHEWNGLGEKTSVGWLNYLDACRDTVFLQSLLNAVILFFEYVPLMTLLALILAAILNKGVIRFCSFFRGAIFIPYVTSMVAVAFTFQLMLDKDYGIFNLILSWLRLPPIPWLQSVFWARISVCLLVVWKWLGYNMILMLAGLQMIPEELYEAARIDGANTVQSFFQITVPMMRPVILFAVTLSTIGTFGLFAEPLVLTNGGAPVNSTITPVVHLYNT